MENSATDQRPVVDLYKLERRVDGLLLKLLDGIERDIDAGRTPNTEAYEALCRAERARTGR